MTTVEEVIEKTIPQLNDLKEIEGPYTDTFTGKEFYVGKIIDENGLEMKVKFTIKFVDMGKLRVAKEATE